MIDRALTITETVGVEVRVVGLVSICTQRIFHVQRVILRAKVSLEVQIGISKETNVLLIVRTVFRDPVGISPTCHGTIAHLRIGIAISMIRNSIQIIRGRSQESAGHNTIVRTLLLVNARIGEVTREASREMGVQGSLGGQFRIVALHTGGRNDTLLLGVTQRERVMSFVIRLLHVQRVIPYVTGLEEVTHIIVSLRSHPVGGILHTSAIGLAQLLHIVFARMTIGVAAISRVISQLRDQRSPRGLSSRLILTT